MAGQPSVRGRVGQAASREILTDIHALEAMPQVVAKALALLNDPSSSLAEVATAIALDSSLAARLLALASSAFFGLAHRPLSLTEALLWIGLRETRTLVLTAVVAPALDRPLPGYGLDRGQLWRHSVACALAARHVAAATGYPAGEEAYLAGLLHDLGKLVLDRHLQPHRVAVRAVVDHEHLAFPDAERQVLGVDHAQVGGLILAHWGLPAPLIEAVTHHHAPEAAGGPMLARLVHVADALAHLVGVSATTHGLTGWVDAAVVSALGLDTQASDRLTQQLSQSLQEAEAFLELATSEVEADGAATGPLA